MRKRIKGALVASAGIVAAGSMAVGAGAVPLPGGSDGTGAQQADGAERAEVREDFNGDGYNDLVIGAPEGSDGEGYLTVVYGSADGLDTSSTTTIGPVESSEENYGFASSLVAEDLDGDGVTDLVVRKAGPEQNVMIFWGAKDRGLSQDDHVRLGSARHMVAGDFNGDGERELLLSRDMAQDASQLLHAPFTRDGQPAQQETVNIGPETGYVDLFALAAGDVTGDGADDLVVIQAMEEGARKGLFFKGGEDGLTRTDVEVPMALSATLGDFDGDGHQDLAYREAPNGIVEGPWTDEGTVHVRYGDESGLSDRTTELNQSTPGIPGAPEEADLFGAALDTGDVDGDGYDDLVVGIPGEAIGDRAKAGGFVLLKGGEEGLSGSGAQAFHQDTPGVPGVAEAGDVFGANARLLDVNGDGKADLAASAPGENEDTGAVWSLRGTEDGLTTDGVVSFGATEVGGPEGQAAFGAVFGNSGSNILWGIGDR